MNAPANLSLKEATGNAVPNVESQERRRLRLYALLLGGDAILLMSSFAFAGLLYLGIWAEDRAMLAGSLLLPLYVTIGLYGRVYSITAIENLGAAIRKMLVALVVSAALLNFITFFARASTQLSRATFATGFLLTVIALIVWRLGFVRFARRRFGGRLQNVLLIAAGGPTIDLDGAYRVTADRDYVAQLALDPHRLDQLGRLLRNQDRVIISCPYDVRPDWTHVLKSATGMIITVTMVVIGTIRSTPDVEQDRHCCRTGGLHVPRIRQRRGPDKRSEPGAGTPGARTLPGAICHCHRRHRAGAQAG